MRPVRLRRAGLVPSAYFLFAIGSAKWAVLRYATGATARALLTSHGPTDCCWLRRAVRLMLLLQGPPSAITLRIPPGSVGALGTQATLSYQMQAWAAPWVTAGLRRRVAEQQAWVSIYPLWCPFRERLLPGGLLCLAASFWCPRYSMVNPQASRPKPSPKRTSNIADIAKLMVGRDQSGR
jgi:hypothetical protein